MRSSAWFAALCLAATASSHGAADVGPGSAPRMDFTPLKPGTYQLQSIQPVRDATLLDERGKPLQLSTVTKGKVTLLTFFYTYCVDPLGCPFARETLSRLRDRIVADNSLADGVRFVGISCDPTTDTPDVVGCCRAGWESGRLPRQFPSSVATPPGTPPVVNRERLRPARSVRRHGC